MIVNRREPESRAARFKRKPSLIKTLMARRVKDA
jgi:hypothetical protein